MELAQQTPALKLRGLGVASIIPEPSEKLKAFAIQHRIGFPLLSDVGSVVIKRLGLVDPNFRGEGLRDIPHAGTFLLDARGVVREKFFEPAAEFRRSAASILMQLGEGGREAMQAQAEHFRVEASASNLEIVPGQRFTLALDFALAEKHHLYAPGVTGYKPLTIELTADPLLKLGEPRLPEPRPYYFAPLKETVPVLEGRFRVMIDGTLDFQQAFARFRESGPYTVQAAADLGYQVCSDRVCYPPGRLSVSWRLNVRSFVQ